MHTDKDNVQVGAIGLLIELELIDGYGALDISNATVKNILLEKPNNTVLTVSGSFVTDGKDGLLYYSTVSGDLDQDGVYNAQAYLEIPGFIGYSAPISFTVYPNLPLD